MFFFLIKIFVPEVGGGGAVSLMCYSMVTIR